MYKRIILFALLISCLTGWDNAAYSQEFSDIAYQSTNVASNIYVLNDPSISSADNIVVSTGVDGILLVDNGFMETLNSVRPLIGDLGDQVRVQINTHFHHAGANAFFGPSAIVIAHKSTKARMRQENMMYGMLPVGPWPESALPNIIIDTSLTLNFNGEVIKLIHYPHAHTDGDIIVHFTKSNVVATGDIFVPALGVCDLNNGGDWDSYLSAIKGLLQVIPKDAKIIPGHGPLSTYEDLERTQHMLTDITRMVHDKIASGKSVEAIQQEGLPAKWESMAEGGLPADFFLMNVYQGLTKNDLYD